MKGIILLAMATVVGGCAARAKPDTVSRAPRPIRPPPAAREAGTGRATKPADLAPSPTNASGKVSAVSARRGSAPAAAARPVALPTASFLTRHGGRIAVRRASLRVLQRQGGHRFVQLVSVRPSFRKGRFWGWRVRDYRGPGRLRAGDVIVRVNGNSLERPDQFMAVWNEMPNRDRLTIVMHRNGRRIILDYPVVDK